MKKTVVFTSDLFLFYFSLYISLPLSHHPLKTTPKTHMRGNWVLYTHIHLENYIISPTAHQTSNWPKDYIYCWRKCICSYTNILYFCKRIIVFQINTTVYFFVLYYKYFMHILYTLLYEYIYLFWYLRLTIPWCIPQTPTTTTTIH